MMQATASIPQHHIVQALPRILVNTRDNLLLLATRKFCAKSSYDRHAISQFKDAFYLLIEDVESSTKKRLAQYIASCEYAPRQIVLYLALEPLEISTPILKNSTTLGQLDLLRIVDLKDSEYAEIIASRTDVGPNLRKRLQQVDSQIVQENLKENFALAEQKQETRSKVAFTETASTDAGSNQSAGKSTQTNKAEANLLQAAARGGRISTPDQVKTAEPTIEFGDSLERAARDGNRQKIAAVIHEELGLTLETTHQVLTEKSGDTLGVLLNAHNVTPQQANRILMLSFPSIGLSTQNARRAIKFYAQLNPASSKAAVDQWPRDNTRGTKHQSHLQDTDRLRTTRTETVHQTSDQGVQIERKTG